MDQKRKEETKMKRKEETKMSEIERIKVASGKNKERPSPQPYVVSGDIVPLLQKWAAPRRFTLPPAEFFDQLRSDFSQYMREIFPSFEFVHEDELTEGLRQLVQKTGLHPISLDRVYYATSPGLDVCRLVGTDGKDAGLGRRPDAPSLARQFREIEHCPREDIVLIDDVIFTGKLLEKIARILRKKGFQISLVCTGIGIDEGVKKLTNAGHAVQCVRDYGNVVDEVCERDFYPGVSLSGRTLVGGEDVGIPYILPFGKPREWASIPAEWQEQFSRFCLEQTIKLFEAIEDCSNKPVLCGDLKRKVISLPTDNTRYIEELRMLL